MPWSDPGPPPCRTPPDGLYHHGPAAQGREGEGDNRRHAPRTKPGSLLRRIPIVSFRELSAAAPGYVEVDLVSQDGGPATGDHCYTLTVTDRCSGWTEIVPVPSRAQVYVFAALTTILSHLPFPVLVLHSDNRSEFINDQLRRFCDAHGIRFTPRLPCTDSCRPQKLLIRQQRGSCVSWGRSVPSPCNGTSASSRHGSSGQPARTSPSEP